ncbi:MAG: type III-B CRISPR module RAMP protein Cmr1 [Bacteroidota bacterium]
MDTLTFTCKIITPMFLHGADGQTPELRAPSIKGAMRFWWRAVNGHLGLDELRKQETAIFGGVGKGESDGRRSKLLIRLDLDQPLRTIRSSLVPHKRSRDGRRQMMMANAFAPEERFHVQLSRLPSCPMSLEEIQSLFQLMSALGGLGKRVRRGMGSIVLTHVGDKAVPSPTLDIIQRAISQLSQHYSKRGSQIIHTYQGKMEQYPWISEISVGTPKDRRITDVISQKTHDLKFKNRDDRRYIQSYEVSMGHAFKGRFASPVYTSILDEQFTPVITILNTIPDRNWRNIDMRIQQEFKKMVL